MFRKWQGLCRREFQSSISLMVADGIYRGKGERVKGGGGRRGLRSLRAWNFVYTILRSAAVGRERGNEYLPWR